MGGESSCNPHLHETHCKLHAICIIAHRSIRNVFSNNQKHGLRKGWPAIDFHGHII